MSPASHDNMAAADSGKKSGKSSGESSGRASQPLRQPTSASKDSTDEVVLSNHKDRNDAGEVMVPDYREDKQKHKELGIVQSFHLVEASYPGVYLDESGPRMTFSDREKDEMEQVKN